MVYLRSRLDVADNSGARMATMIAFGVAGFVGAVAGLVAITPACGFVNLLGATAIGIAAGVFCCLAVSIKFKLKTDDSLDVLAVHFVGACLATGNLLLIAGTLLGTFPALYLRASAEERLLRETLGPAYDAYARRVPMLVPVRLGTRS